MKTCSDTDSPQLDGNIGSTVLFCTAVESQEAWTHAVTSDKSVVSLPERGQACLVMVISHEPERRGTLETVTLVL